MVATNSHRAPRQGYSNEPRRVLPHRPGFWQQRVPGHQVQGLVSGVMLLSGCWLATSPLFWTDDSPVDGVDARWNQVFVGLALMTLGAARLIRPMRLASAALSGGILGLWLMTAPFVLDYGLGTASVRATVMDLLLGALVAGLALLSYVDARPADQSR
jgi:hypothetical protein